MKINITTWQWKNLALIAVAAVFILIAAFSAFQINDPDTLQYLAQGREIAAHGFSQTCVFNYTSDTCQIAVNEWGFHFLTYSIYRAAGWTGLGIFQFLLTIALFFLLFLFHWYKKTSLWLIPPTLLIAALVAMDRFMLRADLLMLIIVAALYWILKQLISKIEQGQNVKWLVVGALLLQLLWTQIHGSFPLGWIMVGAFFGEEAVKIAWSKIKKKHNQILITPKLKILFFLLLGMIAISLINPYGLTAFVLPFKFYFGPKEFHDQLEFQSTFAAADFIRNAVHAYKWLLFISIAALVLNIKKLKLNELFLLVVISYLSVTHIRYIALFAVFAALIIPMYVQNILQYLKIKLAGKLSKIRIIFPAAAILYLIFFVFVSTQTTKALINNQYYMLDQRSRTFGFGLSELAYPIGAAEFIQSNHLTNPLFNDYGSGTYLNWALNHQPQTFIDGHSYTLPLLQYYQQIMAGAEPFASVVDKYKIDTVALNYSFEDTHLLTKQLYNDPAWALVYLDENSLVFIKITTENLDLVKKYQITLEEGTNFSLDKLTKNYNSVIDESRGWSNRGQLLANFGLNSQALTQFQKAVEADNKNFVAYTNLGVLQYQLGQTDEALASYKKAISLSPHYAPAQYDLGLYYQSKKDWDNAIQYLNDALSINSHYKFAHYNLGQIYEAQNKIENAKTEYKLELEINPNDSNTTDALNKLEKQSDPNAKSLSIDELEKQIQKEPNNADLLVQLGVAYGTAGQDSKALEEFQKAVAVSPTLVVAHQNLANAYANQNKFAEAITEYETVIKLDPKNSDAELNLGVINYYQLHNDDKAVEHFQKFLELAPNDQQAPQIQQLISTIVKAKLKK